MLYFFQNMQRPFNLPLAASHWFVYLGDGENTKREIIWMLKADQRPATALETVIQNYVDYLSDLISNLTNVIKNNVWRKPDKDKESLSSSKQTSRIFSNSNLVMWRTTAEQNHLQL